MAWYGIDAVDDAVDATRGFLFPVSVSRWLRVAVAFALVGVGPGLGSAVRAGRFAAAVPTGFEIPTASRVLAAVSPSLPPLDRPVTRVTPVPGPEAIPGPVGGSAALALVAVAVVVLLALVLSPLAEFVVVDALARDDIRLLRDARRHLLDAVRLLGFRVGLLAAFLAPPAVLAAAVLLAGAVPTGGGLGDVSTVALAAGGVVLGAYVLAFALVARFTAEFVVPAMVADGGGVVDGWRRVWPLLAGEPKQTVVYLLAHAVVSVGVSVVAGVLALVGLLAVVVLALAVAAAVALALEAAGRGGSLARTAPVVAGGVVGVPLAVGGVLLPVWVLSRTYRRTYELAALAGYADGLDLLARYREPDPGEQDGVDEDEDDGEDGDGTDDENGDDHSGFGGFVPATARPSERPEADRGRDAETTSEPDERDSVDDEE